MAVIAFIPLAWQFAFTNSDAPGFVILLVPMLFLPALIIIGGAIYHLLAGREDYSSF